MDRRIKAPLPARLPFKMLKCLLCSAYIFGAITPLLAGAALADSISIRPADVPLSSASPTGNSQFSGAPQSVNPTTPAHYRKSANPSDDALPYYPIQSSMTLYPDAMTTNAGESRERGELSAVETRQLGADTSVVASARVHRTLKPDSSPEHHISPTNVAQIRETASATATYSLDNAGDSSNLTTGGVNSSGLVEEEADQRLSSAAISPLSTSGGDDMTTTPPPLRLVHVRYIISFSGNCSALESNQSVEQIFVAGVIRWMSDSLNISGHKLEVTNVTCENRTTMADLSIFNTSREGNLDKTMRNLIIQNVTNVNVSSDINIDVNIDNMTLTFILKSVNLLESRSPTEVEEAMATDYLTTYLPGATTAYMTTSPMPSVPEDASYMIIFTGNCSIIKSNESIEKYFADRVAFILYSQLNISESRVKILSVLCGSVAVEITIINTTREEELDNRIEGLIVDGQLIVLVDHNNQSYEYEADALEVISSPTWRTTVRPTSVYRDEGGGRLWRRPEKDLTGLHIALILVFSVIGGSLIMFGVGFGVYFCCTKRRSKSFNLATDASPQLASMEDFTLTKMERPAPLYTDAGIVLQTDVDETQVKTPVVGAGTPNGQRCSQPDGGGRALMATKNHNGFFPKSGHSAIPRSASPALGNKDRLGRRATPAPIKGVATKNDGSAERLVFTELSPRKLSGFDNPSFSSDELLDGETGTDRGSREAGGHYSSPTTGARGKRPAMAPTAKKCLVVQQEKRGLSPRSPRKRQAPNIPSEGATAL